ncbi:hypothetical protein SAMN06296020_1122 [Anoxynatronum buryatiense]|uniref:Uncharacterized protein n=1 Tax=Anoxynatronum buryatiense TaxID=489973 RepID=A0AA45WXP1_9CLOT|nr:hypothetical protein SAMN06296020_1122 [Anoxynatronum buryatiense]
MFQSTLPHGERLAWSRRSKIPPGFQSTLPHGERRQEQWWKVCILTFQSTLPHGERHNHRQSGRGFCGVSIHAPARGATCLELCSDTLDTVSIHAPARGATLALHQTRCRPVRFNPRSRTGSDKRPSSSSRGYGRFQSTLPHGERPVHQQA